MNNLNLLKEIEKASQIIGKTWPLYSFVTSNPLTGFEKIPFEKAVLQASKLFGSRAFPEVSSYRQASEKGEIDETILINLLKDNGFYEAPERYLEQMEFHKTTHFKNPNHNLDRIMVKWLSAFMDEGLAEWEIPNKNKGFYYAWRKLMVYDNELKNISLKDIPKTASEALSDVLKDFYKNDYNAIFTYHLAALPGWTGYIKYRTDANSLWQKDFPISLEDYLAVRLWLARHLNGVILPKSRKTEQSAILKLEYLWLLAWEKSWQHQLLLLLKDESETSQSDNNNKMLPDAQLVFCIDTRSEAIRRHVERQGNYQTFGYAGFFGIAMDYQNFNDGLIRKSCPPILTSAYKVLENPKEYESQELHKYQRKLDVLKFGKYFLKRMKNMLPSAFGYVEGSGVFYGLSLLARTLFPKSFYRLNNSLSPSHEYICEPEIYGSGIGHDAYLRVSLDEKTAIVKSAFDLMGWEQFAPLVFFVGHGSHTVNNPFGSSLDCGACAASPGRHNARMLAKLANLSEVRKALRENFNISIPDDTFFIGAEHNTTTDEIVVFDVETPNSHQDRLAKVKADLLKIQQSATQERLGLNENDNSISKAQEKASNWSETRPEWGLAKNAGFIIGPRTLTQKNNLDGRCFLHSYNWQMDKNGSALEGIMQGPMVVTQWINSHYYFSTIDNELFGGGSKITQNITGKFGIVKGNGGDLKIGLPLQSVKEEDEIMYHSPLRLSVFIQAPTTRVEEILWKNGNLKSLLDNEWIHLLVMDPTEQNQVNLYQKSMEWVPLSSENNEAISSNNVQVHAAV